MPISDQLDKIVIDAILYSNFIRYDKLKELTLSQFANSNSDELNIYIDMDSVIKPLYNRNILGNKTLYTSLILNLCAHMRGYYRSRHNVTTNIFIVYTDNTGRLTPFDHSKIPLPNRQRDEIILFNRQLLKTIVPYFPRLYYIEGTAESAVLIKNIIDKKLNNAPNVILTKDLLCWQIPALELNTCIFRPAKSKSEDVSYCVNRSNCINMWVSIVNNSESRFGVCPIAPEIFPLYIAFTNFKEKMLSSYFSPREAMRRIGGLILSNMILNGYNNPYVIRNVLMDNSTKMGADDLFTRYSNIDLAYASERYKSFPIANDMSWYFSKIDPDSIKEINDKYFINNPIDIIKLFQ